MKVTRLQLGVYSVQGNQLPFCLYLFPLVASSPQGQDISSRTTIHSPFYRLRDIDAIFFNSENDYVSKSGQIPQAYIETPGYCFHERSGDLFLAARAISDTATRLGNLLLAEFAKLGKSDLISGVADRYLREVSINLMTREPLIEAEFEFFIADSSSKPAISYSTSQTPQIHSSPKSDTNSPPSSSSQISGRKRMSLEEVLDNDDDRENDRMYDQKITSQSDHSTSSLESERGSSTIKKEQSPVYSGGDRSQNSSPNHSPRSVHSPGSPHSPSAQNSSSDIITDYDTRMRKKRRFAIGSNNNITPNNPEVMEQVRNSLKLKQQQKAIIEARQYQAHQQMLQQQNYFNDRQHPVTSCNTLSSKSSLSSSKIISQNGLDLNRSISSMSKRHSGNKSNRNSRNLSVFASPYTGYNHGQRSAGMPASAPTIKSAPSRQSAFGYPLSTNSAFRPTHSASFNANINGLISPHNAEDGSPMVSPAASIRSNPSNPSNLNSPTSVSNEEKPSKESFIHLFDNFYDTVSDTRSLKTTLEDQIRRTTTLLQTLQASGAMIESLVRGHFREMKREVIKDMTALEKRLSKIEERVLSNAANTGMSLSPPHDTDRRLSDISTVSDDMGYKNNGTTSKFAQPDGKDGSSQFLSAGHQHCSPPLSSSSSRNEETQPQDYQDALLSLKARLESLERRMSIP
ncbi:16738_t:CDS:2 [Cetraspora pellucida]|uniref:16738_t:CDS:1 n=1 Tax=Cetraspora pellucida TaxID=1433469 RepID=A0A9N9G9W2_9GLOM|nr:16738_t:CDS:2 [Cetraspora pellucida]